MSDREVLHNTYNIVKYPTKDDTARTIIFNFKTYYIPEDKGNLLSSFYNQLVEEIDREEKDFGALVNILANMEQYAVQMKVTPSRRQTGIYDPIEGRVIN